MSPQAQTEPIEVAKLVTEITSEKLTEKPIVCSLIGEKSIKTARKHLKQNHIPVYPFPERAANSLKTLVDYARIK